MKFTSIAVAALLALGVGTAPMAQAEAAPSKAATTQDFWFICC